MIDIRTIKSKDELDDFLSNAPEKQHLIKFGAEWCGPCKVMAKNLINLDEEKVKDVLFAEISIDEDETEEIATEYKVRNIPCLVVIKDGNEINRSVGVLTDKGIYELLGIE